MSSIALEAIQSVENIMIEILKATTLARKKTDARVKARVFDSQAQRPEVGKIGKALSDSV